MADWYFAGGFLFHRASGKVLLNLRGADAPINPSTWAFFGGASEAEDGGDPVATWCRELREELGVAVDPGRVVPLCDYVNVSSADFCRDRRRRSLTRN